jgi:hypothetical protein
MPQRVPPSIQHIPFYIHPKSQEKIHQNRRANSSKGKINKILTNGCGSNTHTLTNGATNTIYLPLYEMFKPFHANLLIQI